MSLEKTSVLKAALAIAFASVLIAQVPPPTPDRGEILPVAPLPTDPQESKLRQARSRRFDVESSAALRLDEISSRGLPITSTSVDFAAMPELPFDYVDTVILGSVESQQPFLSADRKALYTEYQVQVRCVLKASARPFKTRDFLTLIRIGGVARMPKGHIAHHLVSGYEPIVKGGTYLMFLTHYPDDDSFGTTKLWQVDKGILKALSGPDQVKAERGTSQVHARRVDEVFPERCVEWSSDGR